MIAKKSRLSLKFPLREIQSRAAAYSFAQSDRELVKMIERIRETQKLSKADLQTVCLWKSTRSAGHAAKNDVGYVEEITHFALSTSAERARIESLTLLDGVMWPTASVILHWFHRERYPILDFRALWSVGCEVPKPYTFDFWWRYVVFCRRTAKQAKVDMRTLDRALWQFSDDNQVPGN